MLLDPALIFKDNYSKGGYMSQDFFKTIQKDICSAFQAHEPRAKFLLDNWQSALGSGTTAIVEEGDVLGVALDVRRLAPEAA